MEKFNASFGYDQRLCYVDIQGSVAYASALNRAGILTEDETKQLHEGLEKVKAEWVAGKFVAVSSDEDIHTANERRLTELIGPLGGKLHTGRSRNDQVATDVRLWLREEIDAVRNDVASLVKVMAGRAEAEVDVLMPGYTHLQPAQPIRWAHWLMAHATALARDADRLQDCRRRTNVMPLGSGALAGHPFGIDREALARDLDFEGISGNSLDAVSDRDFIAEFMFCGSLLGTHLSKLAEDLIIYSSSEFGYVKLSDAYATGSSLMPQKKNPDALELLRGKAGRLIGGMTGLLVTLKGLPSTYNKDLQEDKEPLFDAADTLRDLVPITTGVISTLEPRPDRMRASLAPEMLATDLADYLVRKGVPFRETHHVAGEAVQLAETKGCKLDELRAGDLKPLHPLFGDDVEDVWSFEASVESRASAGGTAKAPVLEQARALQAWADGVLAAKPAGDGTGAAAGGAGSGASS